MPLIMELHRCGIITLCTSALAEDNNSVTLNFQEEDMLCLIRRLLGLKSDDYTVTEIDEKNLKVERKIPQVLHHGSQYD